MLLRSVASRQVVVFACARARERGIKPGMTLAEARAMCHGLAHLDHDPAADARSLGRLAQWMIRYSPVAAVEPPDAIFLDMTGSQRLFGDFFPLMKRISGELAQLGFSAGLAIAPTPGAAWAMASFAEKNGSITGPEEVRASLEPLPVISLRLSEESAAAMHLLGIETIAQLQKLPRRLLPARCGSMALTRLDQALGLIAEPLTGVQERKQIRAALEFEFSIESLEMLWEVFKRLIASVISQLRRHGRGARRLALEMVIEKGRAIVKEIHLSRPSLNPPVLLNLLRCAFETVKSNSGFIAISLSVLASESLTDEQLDLFDQEARAADQEMDHLLERLRIRLGTGAVLTAALAPSHLPERAFSLTDSSQANPTRNKTSTLIAPLKSRPLHLLPTPTEIRAMVSPSASGDALPIALVHHGSNFHIVQCSGPEIISGMWWEGRGKTREYFEVEEQTGRRFWIFRVSETRRWFLHGIFDC